MYKPKHLESVFVEICNKNQNYIIIVCIYRHPSMDLQEFNEDFFDPLIENLQSVDKKVFLIGDFNIDLLKVDTDTPTTNFFDTVTSNLFVPHNTSHKNYNQCFNYILNNCNYLFRYVQYGLTNYDCFDGRCYQPDGRRSSVI